MARDEGKEAGREGRCCCGQQAKKRMYATIWDSPFFSLSLYTKYPLLTSEMTCYDYPPIFWTFWIGETCSGC